MSVASRKLHEEARRCLLALTRALRDFDECERAFYQACELPDVERSNRERREGRPVSKALAHTNPARERTFEALVAAFKAVTRQRAMIHAWEDELLLRDIWEELSAARADADRCLEKHVNAQAEYKTKTFSRARLARNEELTPEERARAETRDWVQAAVKRLREEVDEIEAEAEALGEGRAGKKEKEAGAARFAALLRAHRAHEAKLEKLTRLLDNEIAHLLQREVRAGPRHCRQGARHQRLLVSPRARLHARRRVPTAAHEPRGGARCLGAHCGPAARAYAGATDVGIRRRCGSKRRRGCRRRCGLGRLGRARLAFGQRGLVSGGCRSPSRLPFAAARAFAAAAPAAAAARADAAAAS